MDFLIQVYIYEWALNLSSFIFLDIFPHTKFVNCSLALFIKRCIRLFIMLLKYNLFSLLHDQIRKKWANIMGYMPVVLDHLCSHCLSEDHGNHEEIP